MITRARAKLKRCLFCGWLFKGLGCPNCGKEWGSWS